MFRAPSAHEVLKPKSQASSLPPSLPLAHSAPDTQASLTFFREHTQLDPAPVPMQVCALRLEGPFSHGHLFLTLQVSVLMSSGSIRRDGRGGRSAMSGLG